MPTGFSGISAAASQAITVLNTRQVCQLGAFTPYQAPVGHS